MILKDPGRVISKVNLIKTICLGRASVPCRVAKIFFKGKSLNNGGKILCVKSQLEIQFHLCGNISFSFCLKQPRRHLVSTLSDINQTLVITHIENTRKFEEKK
ncbi:MAG: hypothetical protein NZO16_06450 [Deltaproteobacteria bacterium]|nr:hypothetical protein [Deltaproteobacteria bacterium]